MSPHQLSRSELVQKLQNICNLFKETQYIRYTMMTYKAEDHYERQINLPPFPGEYRSDGERTSWEVAVAHEADDAVEQMGQRYDSYRKPKQPGKPILKSFQSPPDKAADQLFQKLICLSIGAIFAIIVSLTVMAENQDSFSSTVCWILILASSAALGYSYFKVRNIKAESKQKHDEALRKYDLKKEEQMAKYAEKMKVYESQMESFLVARQKFLEDYAEWVKVYLAHLKEEALIAKKLEADREAAVAQIHDKQYVPAAEKLSECNDIVPPDYLPALDVIIDLIQTNRADSLKEAINLYEEITYRERQLQLQREQEEHRQQEEQLRLEAAERHHREQMKFQEDQERERRYEEARRAIDAERHHREEMNQRERQAREEQQRLERERRSQKRCAWCAHNLTCKQQYYDGAYNCTGFTPR